MLTWNKKERKNRKIFASWRIIKETKRKTQYIIIFARSRTISRLISRIISENNPLFLSYLKEFPFTNFFHYRWPTLLYYHVCYLKNLTVCFSLQVYYCVYQKKKEKKKEKYLKWIETRNANYICELNDYTIIRRLYATKGSIPSPTRI